MDAPFVYMPPDDVIHRANITRWMRERALKDVPSFHHWTITERDHFWQQIIATLGIRFITPAEAICDLSQGVALPQWLPGATLNIADSCFIADPSQTALYYQKDDGSLQHVSFGALETLTNQIANGLVACGFKTGDAIAIIMPMNVEAVATFLAIIKMGAMVVSIADSFSPEEIATRLRIAHARAVITQETVAVGQKSVALYQKIIQANPPTCVVVSSESTPSNLRDGDLAWRALLSATTSFQSVPCHPMSACNLLFSSGTTGDPKAIPWNHTTPIKAASDAYFHHNLQAGDVVAWPTNLGWMMGPWLVFAALINQSSIALYTQSAKERAFGTFVQKVKVTMLGVVPTLVANWRQTACMEGLDWSSIKAFSSTGECSNPDDMRYLMSLAHDKPIIEYCGGTEIGGAYISSTVVQANIPSLFSTPAMGSSFVILNETHQPAAIGEVALVPPSIGLSTTLLNANHHHVYFEDMPSTDDGTPLRRHGDLLEKLDNGYYRLLGRIDDTMNLSGIKTSAADIERAIAGTCPDIAEVAAIAIEPPQGGPSQLIIFAQTNAALDANQVQTIFQRQIHTTLNPLFKIHRVILLNELPKTASNKIMRRSLRQMASKN